MNLTRDDFVTAIRQAGDSAAILKLANLIERAVVEWETDVASWVRIGLIPPETADDMHAHPELMAHFISEMTWLAQQLRRTH
jgi:hypothetical protein